MSDFEKAINEQIERQLNLKPGTINGDTEFESLGDWDSFEMLVFTSWLSTEYNIILGLVELNKKVYVKELYELDPCK